MQVFFFVCLIKYFIDVNHMKLINGALKLNCILTGFLTAGSVHLCESIVTVFSYDSEFIFFSFHFYQFLAHVVWCSVVRWIDFKDYIYSSRIDFFFIQCPPLSLKTVLTMKFVSSEINRPSTFFWLLLWYVILHPFTFNVYVPLCGFPLLQR